jgi:hypothetical protein
MKTRGERLLMDRLTEPRKEPPAPLLIILVVRRRPVLERRFPTAWLPPQIEPPNRKKGPCPPTP